MSDDYRAKYKLTNEQLERFAEEFRVRNNIEDVDQVDILKCFETGWVWTLKGNKSLTLIEVEDDVLGERDAEAVSDESSAVIRVKKSIFLSVRNFIRNGIANYNARRGVFTLAHELAHVALCHEFAARGRKSAGAATSRESSVVQVFESSERQADFWAGAVLVGRSRLRESDTAETVSARFGVSIDASRVRLAQVFKQRSAVVLNGFKELLEKLNRPTSAPRQKAVEKPTAYPTGELKDESASDNCGLCTECGQYTLCHNHGNNYSCRNPTCGAKNIKLPDGDQF